MPTAKSAALPQPTRSTHTRDSAPAAGSNPSSPRRTRRLAYTAIGVLVGLGLLLPAQAMNAPSVSAASSGSCEGWNSTTRPPSTIRVLRVKTGRIERVPFRQYVVTVMGKEWPSYLPQAVVEAGAVATKQYAWYHALGNARRTGDGRCFDVRDSTGDQLYKPNRARVRPDHHRAVDATWGITLRKHGTFFMTGYRRGGGAACGRDATGYKLFAMSAKRCANKGWDFGRILRAYYGPGLEIVGAGSGSSTSSASGSFTSSGSVAQSTAPSVDAQDQPAKIDDRSRSIVWRGSWRRVRKTAASGDTLTYSGLAGSSATFRFVGRSLELIGPRGPNRGWIDVFVNGRRMARVDLSAGAREHQTTLFDWQWRRSKERSVRIEVVGTALRSRADIDAIRVS